MQIYKVRTKLYSMIDLLINQLINQFLNITLLKMNI
jgi:hypothetical protein